MLYVCNVFARTNIQTQYNLPSLFAWMTGQRKCKLRREKRPHGTIHFNFRRQSMCAKGLFEYFIQWMTHKYKHYRFIQTRWFLNIIKTLVMRRSAAFVRVENVLKMKLGAQYKEHFRKRFLSWLNGISASSIARRSVQRITRLDVSFYQMAWWILRVTETTFMLVSDRVGWVL